MYEKQACCLFSVLATWVREFLTRRLLYTEVKIDTVYLYENAFILTRSCMYSVLKVWSSWYELVMPHILNHKSVFTFQMLLALRSCKQDTWVNELLHRISQWHTWACGFTNCIPVTDVSNQVRKLEPLYLPSRSLWIYRSYFNIWFNCIKLNIL